MICHHMQPIVRSFKIMDALKGNEYRKFTVKDINIEATEAYNDKHPKNECVGYLVTADGISIYFSGDTAQTTQIDYAFLPIDGIYTMNVQEAAVSGICL